MAGLFEAHVANLGKYNEGVLAGEPLLFPASPQAVQALLKEIGVDGIRYETIFIASYDFGGSTLVDVDTENGGVTLLLSGGQTCTAVLLDNSLGVQYSGNVPAASHILRAADGFYLLTDSTVECFNKAGEFQWTQPMDAKPQAGVLNGRQLLVFSGNTVQQVTAPEPDSSSAS